MPTQNDGFIAAFLQTLKGIFTDIGPLLLIVLAPLLYGFLYPWPYSNQLARQIPVAIIDHDNTNLSRQITRYAMASPNLQVQMASSVEEAKDLFWQGKIDGYMVIPRDLKRDVLYKREATVSVATTGSYALLNEGVSMGFAKSIGTLSVGLSIKELGARGQSLPQAYFTSNPLSLTIQTHYNPSEGYSSYVVPAVAIIILHQTLLMGVALMVGTWYEKKLAKTRLRVWLGRIAALSIIGYLMMGFYFGWLFYLNNYTRAGNLWGASLLGLVLVPTIVILGALCGLWMKNRERAVQVILFTSLPMYFLSGVSWPSEGLPTALQYIRWALPSTSGIHASLLYNQLGAPIASGWHYLANIAIIGLLAFGLLCCVGQGKQK